MLYSVKHFVWFLHLIAEDMLKWRNTLCHNVINTVRLVSGHHTQDVWMPNGFKPLDRVFCDIRHLWCLNDVCDEHRHIPSTFLRMSSRMKWG